MSTLSIVLLLLLLLGATPSLAASFTARITSLKPSPTINEWGNTTAIVLVVAIASLAVTVAMFAYVWIRRRRAEMELEWEPVVRKKGGEWEAKRRSGTVWWGAEGDIKKGSSECDMKKGWEEREETVEVPQKAKMKRESVASFVRPVWVEVRAVRAVEVIVGSKRGKEGWMAMEEDE